MLRIGASIGSFRGIGLEEAMHLYLKLQREFDLNSVELRFEKERARPSLWSWEANDEVIKFLSHFEVKGAHLPFIYLNPLSLNPKIKDESIIQIEEAIKKASELELDYCVMHARGFANGISFEEQKIEWNAIIENFADCAKSNSILLTIENADNLMNLGDIADIVKRTNSKWLMITLDIGHAHIRKIPSLLSYPFKELTLKGLDVILPFFLKVNMPYENYNSLKNFIELESDSIFNVHIHDYNGLKDHLAIGDGKIDFSFISSIKNLPGPYILEMNFSDYYNDFKKNYNKIRELMKP